MIRICNVQLILLFIGQLSFRFNMPIKLQMGAVTGGVVFSASVKWRFHTLGNFFFDPKFSKKFQN